LIKVIDEGKGGDDRDMMKRERTAEIDTFASKTGRHGHNVWTKDGGNNGKGSANW